MNIKRRGTGILLIVLLSLAFVGFPACSKKAGPAAASASHKTLYHCAMHPQIVSDHPGECPICHMQLTVIENGAPENPAPAAPHKVLYYRNPMDPSVTSPVPMKDSMGMDYIPVYADENQGGGGIPGQAQVRLSPGIEQQIGVALAPVQKRDLFLAVRAAARVAYDPQLYSASLEHQEAAAFLRKARAQGSPDMIEQAESTVRSSELRLRQMGLSDAQIAEAEQPGYNPKSLLIGSRGGRVWVYANIYDYEAGLIHAGQDAILTSPALPGETYDGTVRAVDSILDAETRTLRARIAVKDAEGRLKPGTYLSAVIKVSLGEKLAVPEAAVVDTGTRALAYVQTKPGSYEPREVKLGRKAEGYYEVLGGLAEGENVVASANFLIDSESRIQAAAQESAKHLQ